jgi:hypothetical protein
VLKDLFITTTIKLFQKALQKLSKNDYNNNGNKQQEQQL